MLTIRFNSHQDFDIWRLGNPSIVQSGIPFKYPAKMTYEWLMQKGHKPIFQYRFSYPNIADTVETVSPLAGSW